MANETFLVVGGCGLLGRHIVADLLRTHAEALLFALDAKAAPTATFPDGVTFVQADITDADAVRDAIGKIRPTVIFNLASPRAFSGNLDFYLKVNLDGTRNLLEAASRLGTLKAFVYTSSSSVVHDAISDLDHVDETAPVLFLPEQREPYHHSKAVAETYVLEANRKGSSKLLTCILRPSGIFGPGDDLTVPRMIQSAKEGKYKWQIGDGKNLFDWTYVENAARAHVLAADKLLGAYDVAAASIPEDQRVDGEAFFITNDEPVPFWDFARSIGTAAGYPTDHSQIKVIPKELAFCVGFTVEWMTWILSLGRRQTTFNRQSLRYSTQTRVFDISKAKQRLGYKPAVSMQDGIERSVNGEAI